MLQFNKAQSTNTNAVWPDVEITSSIGPQLVVEFTQSYDNSLTSISANVLNSPGVEGQQYIVFQVDGVLVPNPSGQYDVNLFTLTGIQELTWEQASFFWSNANYLWANVADTTKGQLLATERAYVSGSNEQSIKQYVSPDENGTYITYNG